MDIKWEATINDDNMSKINEDNPMLGNDKKWHSLETFLKEHSYKIVKFKLVVDGKDVSLPDGMDQYFQGTSATADLQSGKINILSRYIGCQYGNTSLYIIVSTLDGSITTRLCFYQEVKIES